jgi:microsomal dipeptidase-like Zn-dependent dipeptidase
LRVFDGHNDALSRLWKAGPDAADGFLAGDGAGHLDLPRAARGGLAGGCFAVFTCSPGEDSYDSGAYYAPVDQRRALSEALAQVALLQRLERASGGAFRVARLVADLEGDLSHLNARGFWDVVELSDAPLVASQSGAHALCPSPRNLADDQLRAIGASGGLVGINFHVGFVRADGADDADTPLALVAEHAAHVAEVAGVDAVALGSDFDGATMPAELGDVAGLPRVLDALGAAGFTPDEVERIAWRNWRRVLDATWAG